MNATALARNFSPDSDPALRRLHEVTERIRRRAAEARAKAMARGLMRGQLPLMAVGSRQRQGQLTLDLPPEAPTPPRPWPATRATRTDGRDD